MSGKEKRYWRVQRETVVAFFGVQHGTRVFEVPKRPYARTARVYRAEHCYASHDEALASLNPIDGYVVTGYGTRAKIQPAKLKAHADGTLQVCGLGWTKCGFRTRREAYTWLIAQEREGITETQKQLSDARNTMRELRRRMRSVGAS